MRFGVALHIGEVGDGNTGGAYCLDFTAIGPPAPQPSQTRAVSPAKYTRRGPVTTTCASTTAYAAPSR